jgi:hypothetical protein
MPFGINVGGFFEKGDKKEKRDIELMTPGQKALLKGSYLVGKA